MYCNESAARASGSAWTGKRLVHVIYAALLTACAGHFPIMQGGEGGIQGRQTGSAPLAGEGVVQKRTHVTRARDILAEWGTFGIEPRVFRKGKGKDTPQAGVLPALPDYSESIQEIIANATCRGCEQKPYHALVVDASIRHGVPSSLIHAVIQKESAYNPAARSVKNARGLMQVTPATARFVGVRNSQSLYDPKININAGAAYLKYLMRTHNTFDEVLAAYNSGPGNVRKHKGVPPFHETRRYVSDVKKYYSTTSQHAR